MECTGQENDFELIPTVKMETRYSVEGSFDSEFPAICNYCRVMAAGSLKTPIQSQSNIRLKPSFEPNNNRLRIGHTRLTHFLLITQIL